MDRWRCKTERNVSPGQLWMMSNGHIYLVLSLDDQKSVAMKTKCWMVFSEETREVYTWAEHTMGSEEGDVLVSE